MQKINVNKNKLIEILRTNRENHIKEYKEAKIEFRKQAIAAMADNLDLAQGGGTINLVVYLTKPESYEDSYDTAIGMLELSLDDTVELTTQEFQQYVQDKWQWKQSFSSTTAMYNNKR